MSKIYEVEPIVESALVENPETRDDNFLLYAVVLEKYIDVKMPMVEVFKNHKSLGIPSLETITRCRRKLQERNPKLAGNRSRKARDAEKGEMVDYALSDKQWY